MSSNPLIWVSLVLLAPFFLCVPVGYALAWQLFAAICGIDHEANRKASALFGTMPGKSQLISMTEKRLTRMLGRGDVIEDPSVAVCLRRLRVFRRTTLVVWSIYMVWLLALLILALMMET